MKLKKPSNTKISPMDMLNKKRSLADKLEEELVDEGVIFFAPNGYKPTLDIDTDYLALPKNIVEIPPRELGQYLNAFTQQKMYMRTLIGWTECLLKEAKQEYLEKSSNLYSQLSTQKISETAKDRIVKTDSEIRPYYEKYSDLSNKLELLNLNINSIEDAIFLLSREVSRRTKDFSDENRINNI